MWIPNSIDWHKSHTPLSKYFIERLKQRVDYSETISNKHRTTNGFTLISEIVEVCSVTITREKSIHRLISLLKESTSDNISYSIVNDFILKKHHRDIIGYYKGLDIGRVKSDVKFISELKLKSEKFKVRLNLYYYENLREELLSID